MHSLLPALFAIATAIAPQGGNLPVPTPAEIRQFISPEGLDRGDFDAACLGLLKSLEGNPGSPLAEPWMIRATSLSTRAADRGAILDRAAELFETLRDKAEFTRGRAQLAQLAVGSMLRAADESRLQKTRDYYPDYVSQAAAIGSFGDGTAGAIHVVYPPETGLPLDQKVAARGGRTLAAWTPVSRRIFNFWLELTEVGDGSGGIRYVKIQIKSPAPRPCYIMIQAPGSVEMFLNGAQKLKFDSDTDSRDQLQVVSAGLARGWNDLLCKLDTNGGEWIAIQLMDENGRSFTDLEMSAGLTDHPRSTETPAAPPAKYMRNDDFFATWLSKESNPLAKAELLAARGLLRALTDRQSMGLADAKNASALAPENVHIQFALAECTLAATYLPDSHIKNRAADILENILKLSRRKHVPAMLQRAEMLGRDDKMEDALALLKEVESVSGPHHLVERLRANFFRRLEWPSERRKALEAAVRHAPNHAELCFELARDLKNAGQFERHGELLNRAFALDPENTNIRGEREQSWRENGQHAALLASLERRVRLYGTSSFREALASELSRIGRKDDALRMYEKLAMEFPNRIRYAATIAAMHRDARRDDEARKIYDKIHDREPAEQSARNWYEFVDGRLPNAEFFDRHRIDLMAAIAGYKSSKQLETAPDVLVVDQQIERVLPDGSTETEIISVHRINDQAGVDKHGEASFPGELLELKVVHPDGTSDEPTPANDSYAMPKLQPGDFIITRSRMLRTNEPGDRPMLGQFSFQSLERPYVHSEYVLSIPRNTDIRIVEKNFDGTHTIVEGDTDVVHKYVKTNAPRVLPEREAPDSDLFLPWVKAGVSQSMEQLNREYRATQLRGMEVTEEVRAAAKEALGASPATDETQVAKVLYNFTNDTLLERSGNSATRSLVDKRGNPAMLYGALLKAVGVDFELAMVRPIPKAGDDEPEPWFLDSSRYGHLMFLVKPKGGREIWVDVSSKLQPFGERPAVLSDAEAMILSPDGPRLVTVPPVDDEMWCQATLNTEITLTGGQEAKASAMVTFGNQLSWTLREQFRNQTKDILKVIANQISNQLIEGIELSEHEFLNLQDPGRPLSFQFTGIVKNFLREGGGGLEAPLVLQKNPLSKRYAGRSKRKLPLRFRTPEIDRQTLTIRTAESQQFGPLPATAVKESLLMRHSLEVTPIEGGVQIKREMRKSPGFISPADFPAFLALCREIEDADQSKIPVVTKEK